MFKIYMIWIKSEKIYWGWKGGKIWKELGDVKAAINSAQLSFKAGWRGYTPADFAPMDDWEIHEFEIGTNTVHQVYTAQEIVSRVNKKQF